MLSQEFTMAYVNNTSEVKETKENEKEGEGALLTPEKSDEREEALLGHDYEQAMVNEENEKQMHLAVEQLDEEQGSKTPRIMFLSDIPTEYFKHKETDQKEGCSLYENILKSFEESSTGEVKQKIIRAKTTVNQNKGDIADISIRGIVFLVKTAKIAFSIAKMAVPFTSAIIGSNAIDLIALGLGDWTCGRSHHENISYTTRECVNLYTTKAVLLNEQAISTIGVGAAFIAQRAVLGAISWMFSPSSPVSNFQEETLIRKVKICVTTDEESLRYGLSACLAKRSLQHKMTGDDWERIKVISANQSAKISALALNNFFEKRNGGFRLPQTVEDGIVRADVLQRIYIKNYLLLIVHIIEEMKKV